MKWFILRVAVQAEANEMEVKNVSWKIKKTTDFIRIYHQENMNFQWQFILFICPITSRNRPQPAWLCIWFWSVNLRKGQRIQKCVLQLILCGKSHSDKSSHFFTWHVFQTTNISGHRWLGRGSWESAGSQYYNQESLRYLCEDLSGGQSVTAQHSPPHSATAGLAESQGSYCVRSGP